MTWELEDPMEPPEGGEKMRAADTKNKPCILRPTRVDRYPTKDDGKPGDPFVACDVYILDRMGIESVGTDVFFSWLRVYPVLKDKIGHLIGARPVEDGNSIILKKLEGEVKTVAEKVVVELRQDDVKSALGAEEAAAYEAASDDPF